ncbi:ABC transporter permease [Streptomyces sp. B1866]|uniref:ABC transporter permease n=1 Tax=Streptomyces sp. B1866 TaxID=3075431 RepID=UPI00289F581E|nr:ABC transporter permease [Streptomyces sp. B1866]
MTEAAAPRPPGPPRRPRQTSWGLAGGPPPPPAPPARGMWADARRTLLRDPVFLLSALAIGFLVVIAVWPGLVAHGNPYRADLMRAREGPQPGHPFGFDTQGRDVYTRTVYGARASLTVGVCATAGAALLGGVVGGLAGFRGGWWDAVLSRVADVFFGIPVLLGGLVFLSVMAGGSVWPVVGFLVLLGWPQISRIARGAVLATARHDYVQAARALGASGTRVLLRHIAPGALAPVIVVATLALGTYISLEATLSFIGVGLKPPTVSWGTDISAASTELRDAPHMLLWPAGALSITVLAFVMLGDAVREALDPTLR